MPDPQPTIVRDPEILNGMPVFRGTRVPFKNLLDYLEGGYSLDEFLEQFPSVKREDAIAALELAKDSLFANLRRGFCSTNACLAT
jgi:uncharacterized protein (DUF433 family)